MKDIKEYEIEIAHMKLRAEVLTYFTDNEGDHIDFLKHFAEPLRRLINCDQVIYRDLEKTRIMQNSSEIDRMWCVPIEFCQQCRHFDAHDPVYSDGFTEMSNCQKGYKGIPTYSRCPIKSSYTRIVYIDGKVDGYLAIHYIKDYHEFSDIERDTISQFTKILELSISRYVAKNKNKKLEEEAQKSVQEHFKSFHDIIHAGVWSMDINNDKISNVYVSNECRDLLGYENEKDFPNKLESISKIIHPAEKKVAETALLYAIKHKEKYDIQFRFRKKTGEYCWYHVVGRPVITSGKKTIFGTIVDITNEHENIEKNYEIVKILAADYFSVYYVNIKTDTFTIYSMNEVAEREFGGIFRAEKHFSQAYRMYMEKLTLKNDIDRILQASSYENIKEELKDKKSFSLMYRIKYKNNIRYREVTYIRPNNLTEELTNIIVVVSSDDKQIINRFINNKLQEDYQAIYMLNLFDDTITPIVESNAYIVFGDKEKHTCSTAINSFANQILDDEHKKQWLLFSDINYLYKYLDREDRREYVFFTANNKWKRAVFHVVLRSHDDKPELVALLFSDADTEITRQLESQQALERALFLANSANRAKTIFLNNMSHDIRTPMNAIIGYAGLAASHIDNKTLLQNHLSKILQSSEHLLDLINDVLDMSRIESGKLSIKERQDNLSKIIHTVRNIVQADIDSKEIDFSINSVDVNDEDIICDKLRLNQVLLNVLSNAVKYTPFGGAISLKVTEKKILANGFAIYEFVIKDNGIGMSKDFLATIFDPFTRGSSITVSNVQGTGLGMTITKKIVDLMGGTINIDSAENKGTEVRITFKFKLASEHKKIKKIVGFENIRALIVNSDENACINIQKTLKKVGLRSEWCTSSQEVIFKTESAIMDNDIFYIYIIDWLLPNINGIELTKKIREITEKKNPIIILTAYDWSKIEEKAKRAGVTYFITKPIFPSDLYTVLLNCNKTTFFDKLKFVDYDFGGKRILLVEDNDFNIEIAKEILEENGFIIDVAKDGKIAVEKMKKAKENTYNLILMDIQMPVMDGYEATRQIRALKNKKIANIPILAMTANAFEEDKKMAIEAGMNDHIAKPINIDKMNRILSKYL